MKKLILDQSYHKKNFLFHFKTMPKYYMINNTLLQIEELYLNLITNTHKFVYQY